LDIYGCKFGKAGDHDRKSSTETEKLLVEMVLEKFCSK
jgi:hypothetical protein